MKQLRPDQIADVAFYIGNGKCMNLSDPGTGKTPSVVVNQWRRAADNVGRTVWTMPKHLLKKNFNELLAFTPFKPSDLAIVDGTKGKIDKAMTSGAQVLLMGPDRFKRPFGRPNRRRPVSWREAPTGGGGSRTRAVRPSRPRRAARGW